MPLLSANEVDVASRPLTSVANARLRDTVRWEWLRDRLATTPGLLVLIAVLLIIGAVGFGLVATLAEHARVRAAQAARAQTEPRLIEAVTLYTALADANATATTTFLAAGLEPPARRARYLGDLRLASDSVAALARASADSPQTGAAVTAITDQLPVYSGLIEAARVNNRQGFPVGAAYLRHASALLTDTVFPAADRLYSAEAARLSDNYRSGTSPTPLALLITVALVALALLMLTLQQLARISRRALNLPVLGAAVLLLIVAVWATLALLGESNRLAGARRSSDTVEVLSASRVLLSRAQSDESLTLANRGSDETDPLDFAAAMHALAAPSGLLGEAARIASSSTRPAVDRLQGEYGAYRRLTTRVNMLVRAGQIVPAITLAASPRSASVSDALTRDLAAQVASAQSRFTAQAADAASALSGLSLALPLLTALAAGLALLGLRQRLEEYR